MPYNYLAIFGEIIIFWNGSQKTDLIVRRNYNTKKA